jgi:hypothetical protein
VKPPHDLHLLENALRAIEARAYGPPEVLELVELPKPVPNDNQVLIKIHAATVTAGDCEMRRFDFPAFMWLPLRLALGITKPRLVLDLLPLRNLLFLKPLNIGPCEFADRF